jgi:vacuolar-type H+-ATPase subunit E/Vma4
MSDPIALQLDLNTIITGLITAATTLGGIALALKRKVSRDTVEIVKDRAEESVITHLEKQRDKAFEESSKIQVKLQVSEAERMEAISKVAKLTLEVQHLTSQVRILKELVDRLGDNLDDCKGNMQILNTENARLLTKVEMLEKDARWMIQDH